LFHRQETRGKDGASQDEGAVSLCAGVQDRGGYGKLNRFGYLMPDDLLILIFEIRMSVLDVQFTIEICAPDLPFVFDNGGSGRHQGCAGMV
jgi:hypothetical protein